jgi:hypothetical protein
VLSTLCLHSTSSFPQCCIVMIQDRLHKNQSLSCRVGSCCLFTWTLFAVRGQKPALHHSRKLGGGSKPRCLRLPARLRLVLSEAAIISHGVCLCLRGCAWWCPSVGNAIAHVPLPPSPDSPDASAAACIAELTRQIADLFSLLLLLWIARMGFPGDQTGITMSSVRTGPIIRCGPYGS